MEMDSKEFCFYLNEWEKATGKKDIDFCREIGIHKNTILNWKNGTTPPSAKHMKKICDLFDINEVDLAPLSFYTAKDNANKLYYRSQQLQRYARAKGLDEDFYKRITSEPNFMRDFPFSSIKSRFSLLNCPVQYAEDEEYQAALNAIPLVKYEFRDDFGNTIMLSEADIDFMVTLKKKTERTISDEMFLEKHRQEEQKIRNLAKVMASSCFEDGEPLDADKLFVWLTKADVTQRTLTGELLWKRFDEYCETHNVKMKSYRQFMLDEGIEMQHPPMSEEEKQAWKEHGMAAGLTEEDMDWILKKQEFRRQCFIELEKRSYQSDDKESDNDGQH